MIRKQYGVLLICVVMTFLMASSVGAQTVLYGTDRTSTLYTIDPTTGVSTPIGPLGISRVTALEVHPVTGSMYASPGGEHELLAGCLYSVDKITGAATQIGCDPVQHGNNPFPGFSFDAGGTLYAIRLAAIGGAAPQDNNIYLSTINTATGNSTDIGSIYEWPNGNGISFVGGILYHWGDSNGLSTLSLVDGTPTIIGGSFIGFPACLGSYRIPEMDTEPTTGVLYAVVVCSDNGPLATYLGTVNTTTGDVTYLSTLPIGMQEIAFDKASASRATAVPTMTEWGMIIFVVLSGLGAVHYLRRQRRAEN